MQTMTPELLAVLVTMLGIGVALAALILTVSARGIARLDRHIAEAAADRRAFEAQAAADRRAADAKMDEWLRASDTKMDEFRKRMDEFRGHMQRLGERQARVEAIHDRPAPPAPAE